MSWQDDMEELEDKTQKQIDNAKTLDELFDELDLELYIEDEFYRL